MENAVKNNEIVKLIKDRGMNNKSNILIEFYLKKVNEIRIQALEMKAFGHLVQIWEALMVHINTIGWAMVIK